MPHLTDKLLTYIEENPATRIALGFAKGDDEAQTDGRKNTAHYEKLASAVLIPDTSGIWKHCEPKDLVLHIKNRVRKSVRFLA